VELEALMVMERSKLKNRITLYHLSSVYCPRLDWALRPWAHCWMAQGWTTRRRL